MEVAALLNREVVFEGVVREVEGEPLYQLAPTRNLTLARLPEVARVCRTHRKNVRLDQEQSYSLRTSYQFAEKVRLEQYRKSLSTGNHSQSGDSRHLSKSYRTAETYLAFSYLRDISKGDSSGVPYGSRARVPVLNLMLAAAPVSPDVEYLVTTKVKKNGSTSFSYRQHSYE